LKLVQDLGEEALPEPEKVAGDAATSTASSESSEKSTSDSSKTEPSSQPVTTIESQEPLPNQPTSEHPAAPAASKAPHEKPATTKERKPMHIPDTVHVRITPENLKEYVGPPVYQKDRMYAKPPPAGVSTGLGYLGNGSGSVMPIEAMVRTFSCSGDVR